MKFKARKECSDLDENRSIQESNNDACDSKVSPRSGNRKYCFRRLCHYRRKLDKISTNSQSQNNISHETILKIMKKIQKFEKQMKSLEEKVCASLSFTENLAQSLQNSVNPDQNIPPDNAHVHAQPQRTPEPEKRTSRKGITSPFLFKPIISSDIIGTDIITHDPDDNNEIFFDIHDHDDVLPAHTKNYNDCATAEKVTHKSKNVGFDHVNRTPPAPKTTESIKQAQRSENLEKQIARVTPVENRKINQTQDLTTLQWVYQPPAQESKYKGAIISNACIDTRMTDIDGHIIIDLPRPTLICRIKDCNATLSNLRSLKAHINTIHGMKHRIRCSKCKEFYPANIVLLGNHIETCQPTTHKEKPKPKIKISPNKTSSNKCSPLTKNTFSGLPIQESQLSTDEDIQEICNEPEKQQTPIINCVSYTKISKYTITVRNISDKIERTAQNKSRVRAEIYSSKKSEFAERFSSLSNMSEDDLNSCLSSFIEDFNKFAEDAYINYRGKEPRKFRDPTKPIKNRNPSSITNKTNKNSSYQQINAIFRSEPRKAIDTILKKPLVQCNVDPKDIATHYKSILQTHKPENVTYPNNQEYTNFLQPFSDDEILAKISKVSKVSAAGPDKLFYNSWAWLFFNKNVSSLTALFNRFLSSKKIPDIIKISRTILLPKSEKANPLNIDDFRPISIGNTITRIFTGLLADRLSNLGAKIYHPSQRGFLKYDGCLLNTTELFEILKMRNLKTRKICLAYIDLRKAFDLVKHNKIFEAVNDTLGSESRKLIQNLYNNSFTYFGSIDNEESRLLLQNGVKQGCPLSPLLFNLAMNDLLKKLDNLNLGLSLKSIYQTNKISSLAYADDLIIFADTETDLQTSLLTIDEWCKEFGMSVNPKKCASLVIQNKTNINHTFNVNNEDIPSLDKNDFYKYLGLNIDMCLSPTDDEFNKILQNALIDIDKIINSKLAIHNSLKAIKMFILPRLYHHLRLKCLARKTLLAADGFMREKIKKLYNLPSNASTNFFYTSCNNGGLGIMNITLESYLLTIKRITMALNNENSYTNHLLKERLLYSRKIPNQPLPNQTIIELLNTHRLNSQYKFFDEEIEHIKNLGIQFIEHENKITLKFPNIETIKPLTSGYIKEYISKINLSSWCGQPLQGNSVKEFSKHKESNSFITKGSLPPASNKWITKARMDLLPTKSSMKIRKALPEDANISCKKCGEDVESLSHILNKCIMEKSLQTKRHDSIIDTIIKYMRCDHSTVVRKNKVYPFNISSRPDILILNNEGSVDYIIDVQISYDMDKSLKLAHMNKITRYSNLIPTHLQKTGRNLIIIPFILGSLGSIPESSLEIFNVLNINKITFNKFLRTCIRNVILGSENIYKDYMEYKDENNGSENNNIGSENKEANENPEERANSEIDHGPDIQ